jgi:hypothetical protein
LDPLLPTVGGRSEREEMLKSGARLIADRLLTFPGAAIKCILFGPFEQRADRASS